MTCVTVSANGVNYPLDYLCSSHPGVRVAHAGYVSEVNRLGHASQRSDQWAVRR